MACMSTRARIQDTLDRLERWLREHQPALLDAMHPGVTDTELDAFEHTIGRKLPDDVRAFYRWRNGIDKDVFSTRWQPLPLDDLLRFYRDRIAEKKELSDQRGLDSEPGWWHPAWLPIIATDNGTYCVDTEGMRTEVRGQVLRYHSILRNYEIEASCLGDLLRVLVADLERGCISTPHAARTPPGYPQMLFVSRQEEDSEPLPVTSPALPICDVTSFRNGDRVRVSEGPFQGIEGEVQREGIWKLKLNVTFWGRPVSAEAAQLTLVERCQTAPSLPEDWSACEDATHLFGMMNRFPSSRKLRLFTAACFHTLLCNQPNAVPLLNAIEDASEDESLLPVLRTVHEEFWIEYGGTLPDASVEQHQYGSVNLLGGLLLRSKDPLAVMSQEMVRYCNTASVLCREIFPNPFTSARFDPAWRTLDVLTIARDIYDARAFERMPILADALQDAGCDNDELLTHLRATSRTHVRGCWALDLCLGLE